MLDRKIVAMLARMAEGENKFDKGVPYSELQDLLKSADSGITLKDIMKRSKTFLKMVEGWANDGSKEAAALLADFEKDEKKETATKRAVARLDSVQKANLREAFRGTQLRHGTADRSSIRATQAGTMLTMPQRTLTKAEARQVLKEVDAELEAFRAQFRGE